MLCALYLRNWTDPLEITFNVYARDLFLRSYADDFWTEKLKKNHLKVLKQAEIRNLRWSHMDGTAALLPLAGWWQQQARMCHKLYSPRPYKAFTSNFRILC